MEFLQKQKILVGVVLVAIVGAGIYFYSSSSGGSGSSSDTASSSEPVGQDVLNLVNSFQGVRIDPTLFSQQEFQDLKDFTTVLQTESQGRDNPFAPIGSDSGAGQIVSTSSRVKK